MCASSAASDDDASSEHSLPLRPAWRLDESAVIPTFAGRLPAGPHASLAELVAHQGEHLAYLLAVVEIVIPHHAVPHSHQFISWSEFHDGPEKCPELCRSDLREPSRQMIDVVFGRMEIVIEPLV